MQGLEPKCLLSATPLAEQPALTTVDSNSLALMSEAGFIQINAIGLQDLSSLSPTQQSQFIYGPQLPATTLQTPSEDLYDEGAGAVWGSLSDEGAPSFNIPGSTLDGTGAIDMGVDGIMGTDTGGAVYSPPSLGDYGLGDYGPGDTADTGYDTVGVNDAPIPETGDFPSDDNGVDGPGDTGPGDADGSDEPTVGIEVPDAVAWEGPYHVSKLDEAKFILNVTGANPNSAVDVNVKFTGTATSGADYVVKDSLGIMVPLMTGMDGTDDEVTTATFHVAAGAGSTWFKIYAVMDGDYDPHETVIVTILGGTHYQIGNPPKAAAVIEDMTGDLDINGLNEDTEDKPGADIKFNDDDDNHNQTPDYLDASLNLQDNDLVPLVTTSHLKKPNDYAPKYVIAEGQELNTRSWFVLVFDSSKVQIYNTNGVKVVSGVTHFPDADGLTRSLLLEGVGLGVGTIAFVWNAVADYPGEEIDGLEVFHATFDTVKYTVWGLDLDIDSDNNNGFDYPENSEWEEHLEDHTHGLGKLLKPDASHYTPTRLRLQTGLDPSNPDIRLRLDFNTAGQSGTIKVWNTFKADPTRDPTSRDVRDGGNRIYPGQFSLAELGYDSLSGGLTVWLEAVFVESGHWSKKGVEDHGKPDDRITATVIVGGSEMHADEVKYMVIAENSFYDNLQNREELRAAMAAEGVYSLYGGTVDLPNFALRLIPPSELENAGLSRRLASELGQSSSIPGFEAVVYRDYVSGKYVLSFAGTDDAMDALEDVWQGLAMADGQYFLAMELARGMFQLEGIQSNFLITGHSLGGGLASAAAVATGDYAITFNAAGLAEGTILDSFGEEWYEGSVARYHNANSLIDAYYLDWDILSFVQDGMLGLIPPALGRRIKMDGPNDWEVILPNISLVKTLFENGAEWSEAAGVLGPYYQMGLRHTTRYYQYGLMVREDMFGNVVWDIYGDDF